MKKLNILDTFCGAGGSSTGAVMAAMEAGHDPQLTCVNHNPLAIATHTINHPWARHYCTGVDDLNLTKMFGNEALDILWASPSCVTFSTARGGTPINEQDRATAWCVVRIADILRPPLILIENVAAFKKWSPTTRRWNKKEGRWELFPDRKREGETFEAWLGALRSLGYKVDHRILCCADYGDPTTRERLFIQCVQGHRKIVWPNPTHASREIRNASHEDLFGHGAGLRPWIPSEAIIDWSLRGKSIFHRKKPLVEKTLRRIFQGLDKIGLEGQTGSPEAGAEQVPGAFITTIDQKSSQHHTGRSTQEPISTICTENRHALIQSRLMPLKEDGRKISALLPQQSAGVLRSTDEPAPTVATAGAISIITARTNKLQAGDKTGSSKWIPLEPHLVPNFGERTNQTPRTHRINQPLPAVTGHGAGALVRPQIRNLKGETNPLRRARAKTKIQEQIEAVLQDLDLKNLRLLGWHESGYPVVEIHGEAHILDIEFRMLEPHELAAAQGFPKGYAFEGNKSEVIRQIGNAVPCNTTRALVKAALTGNPDVGLPPKEIPWAKAA